ncbi:hypothetical protein [Sulfuriroseicoccus oceanibius]|uniref:Uncharacterized protein n=1 Tax=Sulfuriroseicoccus oceanibius TaxID=2707525 RepID=A0A6B3L9R3_9BACT|nr:hypothetical protein [Sulfuriroseicoccus oceanibius]QQL44109.1 hypothetical protein G3M56_009400 [Sulfuriroseicoccus oceanibius]
MKQFKSPSTHAHAQLQKRLLEWANASGFTAAALNVATMLRDVTVDCAAYAVSSDPGGDPIGSTFIFTCVATRDEFLEFAGRPRTADVNRLSAMQDELNQLQGGLAASPSTSSSSGDDLFAMASDANSRAASEQAIERLQEKIHAMREKWYGKSIVSRMFTANCANQMILVAPPGVCANYELPDGWGLLVPRQAVEATESSESTPASWFAQTINGRRFEVPPNRRLDLLQRIARAQSVAK